MAYVDPYFEQRRSSIIQGGSGAPPQTGNAPSFSSGRFSDTTFEQRRQQILSTPYRPVQQVQQQPVTPQPSFQPQATPQPSFQQRAQTAGSSFISGIGQLVQSAQQKIQGLFTPTGGQTFEIKPDSISTAYKPNLTQKQIDSVKNIKVGQKLPGFDIDAREAGASASLKPGIQAGNIIDEVFNNPIKYTLNNTGIVGETIKTSFREMYENPIESGTPGGFMLPVGNTLNIIKKVNPTLYKQITDNPIYKFQESQIQGAIQGALRVYANWNPEVESFLDKELEQVGTEGDAAIAGNTVGQVIGQIGAFVLGGELGAALKLGKAGLPAVFATLGQTSLPADTPAAARAKVLITDVVAGSLLEYIKPLHNLSKLSTFGKGKAYFKQMTQSMSVLAGQTYVNARSLGATNEEAIDAVKNSALVLLGLHGVMIAGKAGQYAAKSKFKSGSAEFTPEQARAAVVGSNLENTKLGKTILKRSMEAEAQGKNLRIDMDAAQKSKLAGALNLKTPNGIRVNRIELVDPSTKTGKVGAGAAPTGSDLATTKPQPKPPVPIRTPVKTPETFRSDVEKKAFERVGGENTEAFIDEYKGAHGNVVNPDLALGMFDDYQGQNAAELSRASGAAKSVVYDNLLQTEKGERNNTVLITAGGAGSGKSTIVQGMPQVKDEYAIIVDTTFSNNSALQDIDKALAEGYKVNVAFALRDPVEAWVDGALKRVGEEGRVVSEGYFAFSHQKALENIKKAQKKYQNNENVEIKVFENSSGSEPKEVDFDTVSQRMYNQQEIVQKIKDATEEAYAENRINRGQYEALTEDRTATRKAGAGKELGKSTSGKSQAGAKTEVSAKSTESGRVVFDPSELDVKVFNPNTSANPTQKYAVQVRYKGWAADQKLFETKKAAEKFADRYDFKGLDNSVASIYKDLKDKYPDFPVKFKEQTKPATISKDEREAIQDYTRKSVTEYDSMEAAAEGTAKFIDDTIKPTTDKRKLKEYKVIRAEMKRQMYEIAGVDTGNYKRDYAHFLIAKQDPSISPLIDEIERGIDQIDEVLVESGAKKPPSDSFSFADLGGYAETTSAKKFFSEMKPIEMPELVAMTKQMLGSAPALKSFKKSLGKFYYNGNIKLTPEIFKNPELAAKVLAHEMGHMVDWFDQKSLSKRGSNIVGRIASLNKYMKQYIKEYPGSEYDIITPADRKRLQKEARALSKEEVEITTEEIVGKTPIKPDEVLAIWNDNEASIKDPELLKYIQRLSSYQKKSIVVQAMKGTIPKWVKFNRTVKKTVTRKMLKNAPEDIKKLYKKLLKEEVEKRRLFDNTQIMNELKEVSMRWKPFNPAADKGYTKYRFSSVELYADAISVMFNDPALLQEMAPNFWKGFFNYLDEKPEAKKVLFDTWNLLNEDQEAVINKRLNDIGEMFEKGEAGYVRKLEEKQKVKKSLLYKLQILFDDKNTPVNRKVQEALKAGKTIPDELNPSFALHGLNYGEGKLKNYVAKHFNPIYKLTQEIDETLQFNEREMDGWEMLGSVLMLERAANERGELANPGGFNPKTANETLEGLYRKLTPKNEAKLRQAVRMFRESVQDSITRAEKGRFYSPEMLETMKANQTYATFQVLDYIDTYISPHVYRQVGTLKDVANPATSTLMKLVSLHQNIERNNAKKTTLKFLEDNFPDEIESAVTRWDGRKMSPVPPKDPNMGLVTYVQDGKVKGMYVDQDIANVLQYVDNTTMKMLAEVSRKFSLSNVYRPLFTAFNFGFQTFNFVRDFKRYWKNVPNISFPKAVARYVQALPPSVRRGFNIDDALIAEMEDKKVLGLNFNNTFQDDIDPDQKQIERVLERTGILKPQHQQRSKAIRPVISALELIEALGNTIETLPKVAGYMELKDRLPEKEMAEFIRNNVGSPAFRLGGSATPITNSIFLFSNAIKEGIKSDINIAFTKNRSRSGFWFKTFLSDILPKLIMFGIAAGLFGKESKEVMDKQSEYDKTNYTIIPLGLDENGNGVALRIPSDETGRLIGSIFWKLINTKQSQASVTKTLSDILSFGAGQFPNVSPSFTGFGATVQYLSGKNPYDRFRDRYVIPETEFQAGYKESAPIFLDWLIKNQGMGIVMPSKHYGDLPPTDLEKLLEAPILSNVLGRWIKVTSYGETEKLQEAGGEIRTKRAQKTLDQRRAIDRAIQSYNSGTEKSEVVQTLISEAKTADMDPAAAKALVKKFEISLIRGQNDPQVNSLIDAKSNEEKVALLNEISANMGEAEFQDFMREAVLNKIISKAVVLEYATAERH